MKIIPTTLIICILTCMLMSQNATSQSASGNGQGSAVNNSGNFTELLLEYDSLSLVDPEGAIARLLLLDSATSQPAEKIEICLRRAKYHIDRCEKDIALKSILTGENLCIEFKIPAGHSALLCQKALYYRAVDEYDSANICLDNALQLAKETNNAKGYAEVLNLKGLLLWDQDAYAPALENLFQALQIFVTTADFLCLTDCYNNIGNVYYYDEKLDKASEYFEKAMSSAKKIGYKKGIAECLNNKANVNVEEEKTDEALSNFQESIGISNAFSFRLALEESSIGMGDIFAGNEMTDSAIYWYSFCLDIARSIGDRYYQATANNKLGLVFQGEDQSGKAINYFLRAFELGNEIEVPELIGDAASGLSEAYSSLKQFEKAYQYYVIFKETSDEIQNSEGMNMIAEMEKNMALEEHRRIAAFEKQQEEIKNEAERKKQRMLRNAFIIGFLMVLVILALLYRGYKQKKKSNILLQQQNAEIFAQKKEISEAKDLVDDKNRKIMDSIRYAQKIQQAILPTEEELNSLLPDNFVLYRPKDIVSGDFYWIEEVKDGVLFSAIDCTGHGVPGAVMSMMGYNLLQKAVVEIGLTKPSEILNCMSGEIIKTFRRGGESDIKDGMDIEVCHLNKDTLVLQYAAIHNPMYIARKGEVLQFKPDIVSIGEPFTEEFQSYENQEIQLESGDVVYIFSDGYVDQFGGPKRKRLLSRRFRDIIAEVYLLPMEEQKQIMSQRFAGWIGEEEQIDDVLVFGVRV